MNPNLPLGLVLIAAAALMAPLSVPKRQASAVESAAVVAPSSRPPMAPQPSVTKRVEMIVTAYCPCAICCGKWAGGNKTSIGDDPRVCDGVAADPKLLPYRTKLRIPGAGVREVDDTGGAMRKDGRRGVYHIDLRMKTHAEARRWGVRKLKVEILRREG